MVFIKAKVVDPTHLELSEPIGKGHGETVVVSISDAGEEDLECAEWSAVSIEGLRSAYGESEPDYTRDMLKERNPDYVE